MQICAVNGLNCEYVQETARIAIPHPPHLIVASDSASQNMLGHKLRNFEVKMSELIVYPLFKIGNNQGI